jgi:hypothetical protein
VLGDRSVSASPFLIAARGESARIFTGRTVDLAERCLPEVSRFLTEIYDF